MLIIKHTQWVYNSVEAIKMNTVLNIRDLRNKLGITQSEFAQRYNIPFRTVQNWETGLRRPPIYIIELLNNRIEEDLINKKTSILPKYDAHKKSLPKRSDYVGATSWLKDVNKVLGGDVVFALDEAYMCQGNFGGRSDEYLVWVYGDDSLTRFNGVVVIGNHISDYNVIEKNGLKFTDFNRTLSDALANESILDMQGTTEALSKYYYSNKESFQKITVSPKYQDKFEELAKEAIEYYNE